LPAASTLVPQAYCPMGCMVHIKRSPPFGAGQVKFGLPYSDSTWCRGVPAGMSAILVHAASRPTPRPDMATLPSRIKSMAFMRKLQVDALGSFYGYARVLA